MYYCTVSPAYGRDYKSAKEAIMDWLAEKDFILQPTGQYCSVRDFGPEYQVNIRYAKMRKVCVV